MMYIVLVANLQKYDPKGKGVLLDEDEQYNRTKSNLEQEKLDEM